jgi:hypothetical protein
MKTRFKQTKQNALYLAAIGCFVLAGTISAFAISRAQVGRTTAVQTITDTCTPDNCVGILPEVSIPEPATVTPVIVTWSAD